MLPFVSLSGSPYQQGVTHGSRLRQSVAHNLALYFQRFALEIALPADEVLRRASLYLGALETLHPRYLAGMRGIAEGAGVSLAEIAALNVRYEILYDAFGHAGGGIDGCTSFALTPERTGGPLLLGQNWDWIPGIRGAVIESAVIESAGAEGTGDPRVLGFTEAGIFGLKLGLNSAGLGLVINGMTSADDDWSRFGVPFHARCYDILHAATLADAKQAALQPPRPCSANFLLAQLPAQVEDIEVAPLTFGALTPERGALVHANHFTTAAVTDPNLEEHQGSVTREKQLAAHLADGPATLADVQTYLRDREHAPDALCRHPDTDKPEHERYSTIVSAVMNLHERTLAISDGPPDSAPYQHFSLTLSA